MSGERNMKDQAQIDLTLGPVLYHWEPERWRDFYFRIADEAPVARVVLGEIVCSKRMPFLAPIMPEVVSRLEAAGKTVMLASLISVSLIRESRQMAALATDAGHLVEANDVGILTRLDGRAHAVGPFVNVYNEPTAIRLAERGATRICLPPEIPLDAVAAIAAALPETECEIFAFGRAPLAISARCYHARLHGLSKDNCRFVCGKDPDGYPVETLDGEAFLAINGVQTLSRTCCNLIGDADRIAQSGVSALRLSPQDCDMVAVARAFREVLDGDCEPQAGLARVGAIYSDIAFSNGFAHARPGVSFIGPAA